MSVFSTLSRHMRDVFDAPAHRRVDALLDKGRRMLGRRLTDGNVVFRFDPAAPSAVTELPLEQLARCASRSDIEASVVAGAPRYILDTIEPFLRQGATGWAAGVEGQCACVLWTIPRHLLTAWRVPIRPHDLVIYGVVTVTEFRGQAMAARLSRRVALELSRTGAEVYLDTKVWNQAAQRAFGKAGFVRIATVLVQGDASSS